MFPAHARVLAFDGSASILMLSSVYQANGL
jgi:hypothetical protein